MGEGTVHVEVRENIATLTMDRPPVNALTIAFYREIARAFDRVNQDPQVRVVVLASACERAWCAGADIRSGETGPEMVGERTRAAREAFDAVLECAVPVIGAINGPALGAGLALAACCDMLVAAEGALFGLPEIDVGLLGGGRHAQRLVGTFKARRLLYTAQRIPAQELYRLGALEKVVPRESLMEEALALAREVAEKSPIALRLAKRAMNVVENLPLREGYRFEQHMTAELSRTEDAAEARRAFAEKRRPSFRGR